MGSGGYTALAELLLEDARRLDAHDKANSLVPRLFDQKSAPQDLELQACRHRITDHAEDMKRLAQEPTEHLLEVFTSVSEGHTQLQQSVNIPP